jgi:hypothetical protein
VTISEQASAIQQVLQSWADNNGGTAVVVSNLDALWKQAFMSSQKQRLLICFMGEQIRGDFSVAAAMHRVDRDWVVAITQGRGLTADRGDALILPNQNAPAFYDSVEYARDICRCLTGISAEVPVDYKNIEPMQLGEMVADGYLIHFSVATDIPNAQPEPGF